MVSVAGSVEISAAFSAGDGDRKSKGKLPFVLLREI